MDTNKKVRVLEDLSKYKDYLTVGKLKKFLEEHPELPDDANVLILQKTQTMRNIHTERWGYMSVYARKSEIAGAYTAVVRVDCTPDAPASGIVFYIDRVVFRQ